MNLPVRAVSERDLTRSNSLNSKGRGETARGRYGPVAGPRRQFSTSDMSRPSSAASTVDFSPEEYSTKDEMSRLQIDTMPCKSILLILFLLSFLTMRPSTANLDHFLYHGLDFCV